jgi:hypothetical protein
MATSVDPGKPRLTGSPWSVRLGRTRHGRTALEIYDGESLIAIVVPDPVAPGLPRDSRREPARWLGRALVAGGLAMVPWLYVLATELPTHATASHWSLAWTGLDAMEALDLVATGVLLCRRDERVCLAAMAAATLFAVDAWFDVVTSSPGPQRTAAIAMAVFLEAPITLVCAVLTVRTFPRRGS